MIKIGITHGDYNGIGYEVILKSLADPMMVELFTPVLYGSPQILSYYKKLLNIEVPYTTQMVKSASEAQEGCLNVVATSEEGLEVKVVPGEASRYAGTMAARALMDARADLDSGAIDAVVTAPINKDTIQSVDFTFNGHTEFFGASYPDHTPLMIFSAEDLRVALVTMHMPLQQAVTTLTPQLILEKIHAVEKTLIRDFEIVKPRIAVLGLNPHAGENGLLGSEELNIIAPAVEQAWKEGIFAFGPFAADGFWGSHTYEKCDCVLAMYHDQGLIPFKLMAMTSGVNITSGLPVVRTSPDHGTAYDIAGDGVANEQSLRNAIYQAIDIKRRRDRYDEASANPLERRFVEKGGDAQLPLD